jgi:hypothetical protein
MLPRGPRGNARSLGQRRRPSASWGSRGEAPGWSPEASHAARVFQLKARRNLREVYPLVSGDW